MSVQQNLTAVAGNDLKWHVAITLNSEDLNLTPYTPVAYLKASQNSPDSGATIFGIGTGLTYTFETSGQFDWVIPHSDTGSFGAGMSLWYRIDIDNGSAITTAMYGTLTLVAA